MRPIAAPTATTDTSRWSGVRTNRALGLGLAAPSLVVLTIAHHLTPSPTGYGTHLQLGLGPCLFLQVTGWPCPMCGMTTTFAWMAHGHPLDALRTQPFGVVLFTATFAAAAIGLHDSLTGRSAARAVLQRAARYETRVAAMLLIGMALGWVYKASLFHPWILPWNAL